MASINPDATLTRVAESFLQQGLMHRLGTHMAEGRDGRCVLEAAWSDQLTQQNGFFHGGVTASLADTAAGYAALSLAPPSASVLTVEFKINLIRPAKGERLRAIAEVRKSGRTLHVVRAEVQVLDDAEWHACAEFLGTMIVLPGAGQGD